MNQSKRTEDTKKYHWKKNRSIERNDLHEMRKYEFHVIIRTYQNAQMESTKAMENISIKLKEADVLFSSTGNDDF